MKKKTVVIIACLALFTISNILIYVKSESKASAEVVSPANKHVSSNSILLTNE